MRVCPTCGHHFRLSAATRLGQLLDPGTWSERDAGLQSVDRLGFVDQKSYPDRLAAAQAATGMRDAAVWGTAAMSAIPVAICVMDFGFMGGSMGAVVGEKVTRAAEHALEARIPLVVVSASGGARMQEGTLALMQLAKTLAALERLRDGWRAVPVRAVRPDDRRRLRLVRRRRRRQHRRAQRAHRVRRVARLGRDDRPGIAARFPALGVPVRARVHRPGRQPARAARRAGRAAAPAPGPRRGDRRHPGRPRHRDARLPAVLVLVVAGRTGRRSHQRRDAARGAGRPAVRRRPARRRVGAGPARAQPRPARGRSNSSRR